MESSILKAQVARDRLKRDFLDRIDDLGRDVRKLQIGTVEARHAGLSVFPGTLMVGDKPKMAADPAGTLHIGSDLTEAAGTHLSIFAQDGTYNGESVGEGDLLIGDNSASKANIYWDKSTGQLKFRGGATTQLTIDTSGQLLAGDGEIVLNSSGLRISAMSDAIIPYDPPDAIRFGTGDTTTLAQILCQYGEGAGPAELVDLWLQVAVGHGGIGTDGSFGLRIHSHETDGEHVLVDNADLKYEQDLVAVRSGTEHTGCIYVPLQDYISVFDFASLTTSSSSGTAVNLPSTVPAEAKAVQVRLVAKGTVGESWIALGPDNDANSRRHHFSVTCHVDNDGASSTDYYANNNGVVNINSSIARRIYRTNDCKGGTMTWTLLVTGYYI